MHLSTQQKKFLNDLKNQTSDNHAALEGKPASRAILSGKITVAQYQYYLLALYSLIKAFEIDLFPLLHPVVSDLDARKKSHLIANDLLSTGYPSDQLETIPATDLRFAEMPEALGLMYVLEGSTLGGRILYKHVHETLGLDHTSGASYFAGYGANTGIMWTTFTSMLSTLATEGRIEKRIIDAANEAFTLIEGKMTTANNGDDGEY